jgi:hypothetical protein
MTLLSVNVRREDPAELTMVPEPVAFPEAFLSGRVEF